jgi:hypothetical protein
MYVLAGLGQPQSQGDCSGWEKDPQSFSKRIAERWVSTVLTLPLAAKRASPIFPGNPKYMEVTFSDDVAFGVSLENVPGYVFAFRLRKYPKARRFYTYSCTPQGQLVLTERQPPPPAPKAP